MQIKELKTILLSFEDNKDVMEFDLNTKTYCSVIDFTDGNGHLQLNLDTK